MTTGLSTRSTDNTDLFTPKNEKEVDFIWMKYPIENSIWTDFVRANTSAFFRESFLLEHVTRWLTLSPPPGIRESRY